MPYTTHGKKTTFINLEKPWKFIINDGCNVDAVAIMLNIVFP
jgi:hypothetical protein